MTTHDCMCVKYMRNCDHGSANDQKDQDTCKIFLIKGSVYDFPNMSLGTQFFPRGFEFYFVELLGGKLSTKMFSERKVLGMLFVEILCYHNSQLNISVFVPCFSIIPCKCRPTRS